jgi:hypothetical protein
VPNSDLGVIYIAYGAAAQAEARESIASLRRRHKRWPVLCITDAQSLKGADIIMRFGGDEGWGARRAKLNVDKLSPWDRFLYLDADTRIGSDLSAGFDILADGWDLVITASDNQESRLLWHVPEQDKELTLLENPRPLQLQGGVFYVAKGGNMRAFFEAWREEWQKFGQADQGALIRALHRAPVRVWIMGRPYNGGEVVQHRFGAAKA